MSIGLLPSSNDGKVVHGKQNGAEIRVILPKHVSEHKRYTTKGEKNRVS
jgi:hypothetical protein